MSEKMQNQIDALVIKMTPDGVAGFVTKNDIQKIVSMAIKEGSMIGYEYAYESLNKSFSRRIEEFQYEITNLKERIKELGLESNQ